MRRLLLLRLLLAAGFLVGAWMLLGLIVSGGNPFVPLASVLAAVGVGTAAVGVFFAVRRGS